MLWFAFDCFSCFTIKLISDIIEIISFRISFSHSEVFEISISLGNCLWPWPNSVQLVCAALVRTKKDDFSSYQMLILLSKKVTQKSPVSSSSKKLMKNLSTSQPSGFSYSVPRKSLTMINWKSFLFFRKMFSLLAKGKSEEHIIMKLVYHSPKKNEKLDFWKEKLFHNSFASRFQGSQRKQKRRRKLNLWKCFWFFPLWGCFS